VSERLRLGLIGCGEIAVQTSKAVLASQACQVVHCADTRKDLADDLAAKHEARSTTRYEDVLADKEVQAVVLAVPHSLHAPIAIAAAKAGKHILGEKPMAANLTEADAMIAAARKAGVKLGLLFPMRYSFNVQKARELVAAGAIGRVIGYQFHAMMLKPASYWHGGYTGRCKDDWRMYLASSGGGILIMNLVHNLDAFVHILDPKPQRIYAEYSTLNTPVEVEDCVSFVMRLKDGVLVTLDASSTAPGKESFGDRIYGEKGQIAFVRTNFGVHTASAGRRGLGLFLEEPWGGMKAQEWLELLPPEAVPPGAKPDARRDCLDAYARAVLDGTDLPCPGEQGRRSLEIIRGAYLSMKRGAPVAFPVKE
jgi:predicted dehydrogenase